MRQKPKRIKKMQKQKLDFLKAVVAQKRTEYNEVRDQFVEAKRQLHNYKSRLGIIKSPTVTKSDWRRKHK
jgi:hypothetical protein